MLRRNEKTAGVNLDSLVDIVSNNVGILIILAAFMALFALLNPGNLTQKTAQPLLPPPTLKLKVPWAHPTTKTPVYFAMHGGRIQHLDMKQFYKALSGKKPGSKPEPVEISQKSLDIRFFPVTNQIYCMEFEPHTGAGETLRQAKAPGSEWNRVLSAFSPERFTFHFWVRGDSFSQFREIREDLWKRQIEVGWKPVLPKAPMETCNGFERATGYQPQ